jgi:hypothetical protein
MSGWTRRGAFVAINTCVMSCPQRLYMAAEGHMGPPQIMTSGAPLPHPHKDFEGINN